MFKHFAALALVGAALVIPTRNSIAQHLHHSHGHGHHGHDHHGHILHGALGFGGLGFSSLGIGGLGYGYWPYSYGYSYPGLNLGWPYYGAYYSYPSAYYLGSGPYYLGSAVTFAAPRTTIITVPNVVATVPDAAAPANPRVAARPVEIQFGGFAQIGELATRLVQQTNDLCLDLHHNYQRNAGFADTYRAAYQIFETAKFVSAGQGDRQEIAKRVNELDALFHQVQSEAKRFRRRTVRQIAGTGLQTKLNDVETTLHELMTDVGVMGTHGAPQPAPAPAAPAPAPANAQAAPPPLPPPLPAPNPPGGN
jgi:hypothetical protein